MPSPPYPPSNAALGGVPNVHVDVPITAVFLFLFICGAVTHMTIFQTNKRRGHKFIMSGMMFGFCMTRITATTMRIVWATRPHNIQIAIAAQVFVAAGVILLYAVNLIFTQRIVRASHPNFGWHPFFSVLFKFFYASIVGAISMLIVCTVQQFYTLDPSIRDKDHKVVLVGGTWFAFLAFLPIPFVIGGIIIPKKARVEKFGQGRFRSKIRILLAGAALLTLGASFRVGVNYKVRPITHPAWYHSKACFYLFNFTIDLVVVLFYALIRVDKRFHIPDGSQEAGDYASKTKETVLEKTRHHINSEEEVFDDQHKAPSSTNTISMSQPVYAV